MTDKSLFDIVIINWNAHNQLDACLGSLPQPISENIFSVTIVLGLKHLVQQV